MNNHDLLLHSILDAYRTIIKYNTITDEVEVIKDDLDKIHPANLYSEDYIRAVLESGIIYEDDRQKFHQLNNAMIRMRCSKADSGLLLSYRYYDNGSPVWAKLYLMIPSSYSESDPYVILCTRNTPAKESMLQECDQLVSGLIHKTLKANLTTNRFCIIKESPFESHLKRNQKNEEFLSEHIFSREELVHPDDAAAFEQHLNHAYIRNYFRKGNTDFTFYYRRLVYGLYRWVKLIILPASDYSVDNEVFYYYVIDIHKEMLNVLDINAASNYAYYYGNNKHKFAEGYYENLLQILELFTHSYIDFYAIDLERDLFTNYKISKNPLKHTIPYVGSYTQITADFLQTYFSKEQIEQLLPYSTSEKLRDLLKDRLTLSYSFRYPTGQLVTTTFVKMEAKNGIPTKLLCFTSPCEEEKKIKIQTFGNFEVMHADGTPIKFSRKYSRQLLAYLVDKNGFPVTSKDIVIDILEKDPNDLKAVKYVSTLIRRLIDDLAKEGYDNIIIKEQRTIRLDTAAVDCDYYHFLDGEAMYWSKYHNEYMKEYSWAEETNAELLHITDK